MRIYTFSIPCPFRESKFCIGRVGEANFIKFVIISIIIPIFTFTPRSSLSMEMIITDSTLGRFVIYTKLTSMRTSFNLNYIFILPINEWGII